MPTPAKTLEYGVALGFMAIGILILYYTGTEFAEAGFAAGDALQNAALFPNLIAYALIALSLLNILMLLLGRVSQSLEDGELPVPEAHLRLRVIGILVVVALYLMVVKSVGYDLSTPVMMFAMFAILGAGLIEAALLGIGISILLSVIFEQGLNVIFPVGQLGLGF